MLSHVCISAITSNGVLVCTWSCNATHTHKTHKKEHQYSGRLHSERKNQYHLCVSYVSRCVCVFV